MNCLPSGIGYQMSIPHRHADCFVPHQFLNAVNVCSSYGQPAGEGVAQAVLAMYGLGLQRWAKNALDAF